MGSSKITTLEPPTNAIATDNFLCMPPVGRHMSDIFEGWCCDGMSQLCTAPAAHQRGSEPRRFSCEEARGPAACSPPPAVPRPECDPSGWHRKGCALPLSGCDGGPKEEKVVSLSQRQIWRYDKRLLPRFCLKLETFAEYAKFFECKFYGIYFASVIFF